MNKHHGDIRVETEPGRTTFRVLLPITEGAPDVPRDAPAT
ncbi:hypothetical protein NKG94_11385 [Micromonospora sp. M12]